jgi:predicted branched-subunit amino acid permease
MEKHTAQALGSSSLRDRPSLRLFVRGFVGLMPLWTGAIPVGIAYGVAARSAGLSLAETQIMSLTVFSAAAQVSAVSLIDSGASWVIMIVTAMALNVQLLLFGLAVGREERPAWLKKLAAAYVLTDGAYGVALAGGRVTVPGLAGAGVSMYVAWNIGTALGAMVGHVLPDPHRIGVDYVVTLTFLAVLVPLIRSRAAVATALAAAIATLVLLRLAPSGVSVLGAGLAGAATGAWWSYHAERRAS